MSAANISARCSIGFGCHAAGIHDDHITRELIFLVECKKPLADRVAIRTRRPATEIFNMKAKHHF